ncbi:MAG: HEAT repeat domain-containing protein [Balneolaceae bacterium]|nr:HEAT repeat domain-containing protein [Balneolaceae bacterium]
MSPTKLFTYFTSIFIIVVGVNPGYGQSFDYSRFPKLDFSFRHLTLELKVDAGSRVLEGRASYRLEANIGGVENIILHAAHMDIEEVELDGRLAEFHMENDSLIIRMSEASRKGRSHEVTISYNTEPVFGVHFEENGTVWSSFLPLTTRHWIPVVDHPRVSFTTEITLSTPGDHAALAPGQKVTEEITSVEEKRTTWSSRRPIPASSLWFATGPFRVEETSFGIKKIHVSGSAPPQTKQDMLAESYREVRNAENRLGIEYPFESLHLVLLEDHRWEAKPYGAGVIHIFKNRGDLSGQLRRGIYAQWYGVFQREEQWADAEAMNLYQTAVHYRQGEETSMALSDSLQPEVSVNPYRVFGPRHWNLWQKFYGAWDDSTWKAIIEQGINAGLTEGDRVRTWKDFASQWYRESGQPWLQPPKISFQGDSVLTDSVRYRVEYHYDGMNDRLALSFQAVQSPVSELVTLPLVQYIGNRTDTLQVTFTGRSDSVLINLDPSVSYVAIDASDFDKLTFEEKKPVPMILNQLRGADSPSGKAAAARQLAQHTDNPDLQLAIMDMLSREKDPQVRAALYYALGEITGGAQGTEQIFLDAIREDSPVVQAAAARALQHYRNNDQVVLALHRYALRTRRPDRFRLALNSLASAGDLTTLREFSRQVMNEDSTGNRAIQVLTQFAGHLDREYLVKNLGILTGTGYSYAIRSDALKGLARLQEVDAEVRSLLKTLAGDRDPRIRLLTVRAIDNLESEDLQKMLRARIPEEYDGRVYFEIRRAVEGS